MLTRSSPIVYMMGMKVFKNIDITRFFFLFLVCVQNSFKYQIGRNSTSSGKELETGGFLSPYYKIRVEATRMATFQDRNGVSRTSAHVKSGLRSTL